MFVLFHQHGQQHDLKWKEMGGVGGGRQVMSGGGQKIVESTLVLPAKGSPKSSQGGLLLEERLSD